MCSDYSLAIIFTSQSQSPIRPIAAIFQISSLGFPRILLPCSCSWHLPSGWPARCLSYSQQQQQQQQMHREEKAARPGDAAT